MAYRLPGGRVTLAFEEGQYAGLSIEVEPIASWAIYRHALALVAAFFAATEARVENAALRAAYEHFVGEAQPTWSIVDHRGPIQPTTEGLLRLPLPLGLRLVELWSETFIPAEQPETAVDELIPPGPLRDEMNARLRVVA